jgi:hypothetical protein
MSGYDDESPIFIQYLLQTLCADYSYSGDHIMFRVGRQLKDLHKGRTQVLENSFGGILNFSAWPFRKSQTQIRSDDAPMRPIKQIYQRP